MPQQEHKGTLEATPNNPVVGTAEDRKKAVLGPKWQQHEQNLLKIRRDLKQDWAVARRQLLRQTLRYIEYDKNNQFISWDPFTSSYVYGAAAFALPGQAQGTEQGNTDYSALYQCRFNIIQWLKRNWVSTLGAAVPGVEWWPGDSESDLDNRAAQARGRAYRKIAFENKDTEFLEKCLNSLFLTGSYFVHTRWCMDKDITGLKQEPIVGSAPKTVMPDRYTCPRCGTDNPANAQTQAQGGTICMNCGNRLNSANFFPALQIDMPVITGYREVPRGQVLWDVANALSVEVLPQANTSAGGVIKNSPILDYQIDITKGAFRRMYPDDDKNWDMASSASSAGDGGSPDAELGRMARTRVRTPAQRMGIYISPYLPTLSRVWYQPDAIMMLDDKEAAKALADVVQEGICVAIKDDTIVDIRHAVVTKEWTWCGASKDVGAYPPAPVDVAMDFQDRINDRTNAIDEFHDRAGSPPILFSQSMVGESLNGKFLPPASLIGLDDNKDLGRKLEDAFFQPTFHMDNGIYEWVEQLFSKVQLLVGITPQTYGGSDKNIKTATGQEQALKTAQGILWLYWNMVRGEWTERANLSVDCFAQNATDDEYHVAKGDDAPDFQNEPIRLADLEGKADARPVANQDYPIGYEQQREIYQQLINMASGKEPNPLVIEVLDTYENRRLVMRYLGPPDMELPETPFHDKVINDIAQLIAPGAKPIPTVVQVPDPQTGVPTQQEMDRPTVEPDPDYDDFDVSIPTVMRYVMKHYKELEDNPEGFANLRAYTKLCFQFKAKKQAEQQLLTTGAPGWGGNFGGPKETTTAGGVPPAVGAQ